MQADSFWQIIGEARITSKASATADEIAERHSVILATKAADEIIDFAAFFERFPFS